jgi:hypothetical protein
MQPVIYFQKKKKGEDAYFERFLERQLMSIPFESKRPAPAAALSPFDGAFIWRARTRPRFVTGRHVAQWESGDSSPHSKLRHFPPSCAIDIPRRQLFH